MRHCLGIWVGICQAKHVNSFLLKLVWSMIHDKGKLWVYVLSGRCVICAFSTELCLGACRIFCVVDCEEWWFDRHRFFFFFWLCAWIARVKMYDYYIIIITIHVVGTWNQSHNYAWINQSVLLFSVAWSNKGSAMKNWSGLMWWF